jgi:hypothetical protein
VACGERAYDRRTEPVVEENSRDGTAPDPEEENVFGTG